MIRVRGQELHVDVMEELSFYIESFDRGSEKVDEFVSCSPFRSERTPSFSISLDTGQWIDFGADEYDLFKKGGLVKLLSFLRNETYEEAEHYLLDRYGIDISDPDVLAFTIDLQEDSSNDRIISLDEYRKYAYRHNYLATRGISEKVQRSFKVGYDKRSKAITFPWMNRNDEIVNIKYRSVKSKQFYYYGEGQPIRNHLYGMNFIHKLNITEAYIVESEIDALYLWTHGFPAVALGGSNLSSAQSKLFTRSPIENLIIAVDNDSVGEWISTAISKRLNGLMTLEKIKYPNHVKDVNDLSSDELVTVLNPNSRESTKPFLLN
ncbi:toprim domain-containing protein [Geomicrobium sp. JCM 19055]|uniref:toprim domain-containing protein n=1 Tax=Geomicrobium sp. JCM 19055 TaxID=1460649 RepID=UPI00045ED43A|nr:toprim domain-containing protein [Geomicrobium sp. JCM 19055]GAK00891.1 DNA primase [Geomicrobium sp. JCM 19055]